MPNSKSMEVRRRLDHPVVDGDGHWLELRPIFLDYLSEVGGPKVVDSYRKIEPYAGSVKPGGGQASWYATAPDERMRQRMRRNVWWAFPANAEDRAAVNIPAYFYDRLDDWGIDVALVFPTMGLAFLKMADAEMRQALVRAYNVMVADMFNPFADRIIAAGCIALNSPSEAIEQLEHAHSLGLKLMTMNGSFPRPVAADADWQPDVSKRRVYIDGIGLDNPYDYDPVWQKCMDLKVAVNNHLGSNIWPDRSSTTNLVANHLGHFAQAHHLFARHLFLGGVSERFPNLAFGFLEGGVGWACNLYLDLIGHWEKRNHKYMREHLKPDNIDKSKIRTLFEKYTAGNPRFAGKINEILKHNLDWTEPDTTLEELARRDIETDDFSRVRVENRADISRLFAENFYFGCEADDPMTALAFNTKLGAPLKPFLGSDIGHFDVKDSTEVLEEAWEMVEGGLLDEKNFREFTFTNVVEMHCKMNPDFFKGTVIENEVAKELELRPKPLAVV